MTILQMTGPSELIEGTNDAPECGKRLPADVSSQPRWFRVVPQDAVANFPCEVPGKRVHMDTVLVIEDSRPMQRTLQRLFESDALEVHIASDGDAGLESFRRQTPSVVVLDLKLPRLSGKELCRMFKTDKPAVPIVVLSADSEVDDKVLLLELGADDYVTKPFSPKELLARVRRAMRSREMWPGVSPDDIRTPDARHLRMSGSTSPAWRRHGRTSRCR